MRILMVTPALPSSLKGNGVTAGRWARILRALGHRLRISVAYDGKPYEMLIALHARRSASAVWRFQRDWPGRPILLALTGTDLYGDLTRHALAQRSVALATRLILLQADGLNHLPATMRSKGRVILQSATPPRGRPRPLRRVFEVCVASHLRAVKDPLRAALAVRDLPPESRIHVNHYGIGLDVKLARRAERETETNPRYNWRGPIAAWQLKQRLARSRLLVLSSRMEGGANVISESLVCGAPVLSTRISGSLGLLGERYPGYFEVGDTQGLAELLVRAESQPGFYAKLADECRRRAWRFSPEREVKAWAELLAEFP